MMSINFSNIAILNIKVSDYCCIISLISKNEVINLMQNVENCKFEKKKIYKFFWKHIKKWEKKIYKIWWYWNPRTKISPAQRTYSNKNMDINKIVVYYKVSFDKKAINILLATKMLKQLGLYVYFSQKWMHIENTLMNY